MPVESKMKTSSSRVLPIERVYVQDVDQEKARRYANETGAQVGVAPNPDLIIMRVRPDFPRPAHRAGQRHGHRFQDQGRRG